MIKLTELESKLLREVAALDAIPSGAFSLRKDGQSVVRNSTAGIEIVPKADQPGIDIFIKPNLKNESVHIPVIMTASGLTDLVYNDFYVGENADVVIVAGCGIDNCGTAETQHNGVHTFHLAAGSRVRYVEKHLGTGAGSGGRVLNPVTKIYQDAGSQLTLETVQLGGVTSSRRVTTAELGAGAKLSITERILTTERQTAQTEFSVVLAGADSAVDVVSRSVARDDSQQDFVAEIIGRAPSAGHVECDGILLDRAVITSTPKIRAENVDARLMHEATIGKIAGEQLTKLQTLGLTATAAETLIIQGFLS